MKNQTPNHLIHENSPYLLQHAYNPVEWFPWGDEALQKAKNEDKPILVSIGYAACHWCHVMEHESFEDEQTAKFMNTWFVNIKVDREERPDIDNIYMNACQLLTGAGGWPLNIFLTPDLLPFSGGTYFPPKPGYGKPSWMEVLMYMKDTFSRERDKVEQQANAL
ncbi:MAG: thioredoxin domain-containing protein, partial [Chitinophagales bacterium]|nr:thioredoxin domain-containing protein [Chitinophagales bacterium]